MRKFAIILTGTALLGLSACGKSDDSKVPANAPQQSASDVATQMRKVSLHPGQWETTQEVVDVQIDNAPKDMPAGMMNAMKGRKTSTKSCVTAAQAEKPDADFLAARKQSNCTYKGFEMAGGTIRGAVSCAGGEGGAADISMSGNYTPESYDMNMEMVTTPGGADHGMKMRMKMKTSGKRIGECPPAGAKS